MHGQTECLGNILELCAASLYPDPKIYLGFTMCLSRDFQDIPERDLVQDCALEHGIDFDKLNHCVSQDDGAYAMGMLRESVERSAEANVTKSCTVSSPLSTAKKREKKREILISFQVRLNNEIRCIRDGGEWKDCEDGFTPEDLVRDIDNLYKTAHGWSD